MPLKITPPYVADQDIPSFVEAPQHYYATSVYGWSVGESPKDALADLARSTGAATIKASVKHNGGLLVNVCKVHAPMSSHYDIDNYVPVGIETSELVQYRIVDVKGRVVRP